MQDIISKAPDKVSDPAVGLVQSKVEEKDRKFELCNTFLIQLTKHIIP